MCVERIVGGVDIDVNVDADVNVDVAGRKENVLERLLGKDSVYSGQC